MVRKISAMIYIYDVKFPNAQIWSFLAENCPKPSEILRIAKKRCFHHVPCPKNDDFDFLTCIWKPS